MLTWRNVLTNKGNDQFFKFIVVVQENVVYSSNSVAKACLLLSLSASMSRSSVNEKTQQSPIRLNLYQYLIKAI